MEETMSCNWDNLAIMPARTSRVSHRSECITTYEGDRLPIFTAPMMSVVNTENLFEFHNHGITPIVPRNIPFQERLKRKDYEFIAVSLDELASICSGSISDVSPTMKICLDIANGHMLRAIRMVALFKSTFPNSQIIAPNIANGDTYIEYANAGADYVRVGIGTGTACLTSQITGVGVPIPHILESISCRKSDLTSAKRPLIIADGGITTYDAMIKALALGADYVMLGARLTMCKEACGHVDEHEGVKVRGLIGMSTTEAQEAINGLATKQSEGTTVPIEVIDDLSTFTSEFKAALSSAMSYCDAFTLEEFIGKAFVYKM